MSHTHEWVTACNERVTPRIKCHRSTRWRIPIRCLIFTGHFLQKSLIISGSFAEMTCNLVHPMGLRHSSPSSCFCAQCFRHEWAAHERMSHVTCNIPWECFPFCFSTCIFTMKGSCPTHMHVSHFELNAIGVSPLCCCAKCLHHEWVMSHTHECVSSSHTTSRKGATPSCFHSMFAPRTCHATHIYKWVTSLPNATGVPFSHFCALC